MVPNRATHHILKKKEKNITSKTLVMKQYCLKDFLQLKV